MSPLHSFRGLDSKQEILNSHFQSRLKLAIIALTIQLIATASTIKPFRFTILFNAPAILALILCLDYKRLFDYGAQKQVKVLLKIGLAKAVGGVILALYMGLKYACMPSKIGSQSSIGPFSQEGYIKIYAIHFATSALIDFVHSLVAKDIIKNTKLIISQLKVKKSRTSSKSSARSSKSSGTPRSSRSLKSEKCSRSTRSSESARSPQSVISTQESSVDVPIQI